MALQGGTMRTRRDVSPHVLNVETMPPTRDRESHCTKADGYGESDQSWALAHPEAVAWLIDNHRAIREAIYLADLTQRLLTDSQLDFRHADGHTIRERLIAFRKAKR